MNFSNHHKLSKILSLILVLIMMTTLFAGCKKNDSTQDTTEGNLKLELNESTQTEQTQTIPPETTVPVINENTATVTAQLSVRSAPSMDAAVVAALYAGDKIEISRREHVAGIDWAYIIKPEAGWVVMDYVAMDIPSAQDPSGDTSTPGSDTQPDEKDDQPANTTNIKGVINANGLNIRSEASTNGKVQGSYNKGDVVTILETKNGWGRTNKGWVKMEYVSTTGSSTTNKDDNKDTSKDNDKDNTTNTTITSNGSTTVQFRGIITASELNIRASASQTATRLGSYKYGNRVEILEKDGTWGRTKNGWISLNYVYQDGTTGSKTAGGVVTGSQLNIRSGPGTDYGTVGSYNSGDRVSILEQFTYDGVTWGCTNKGWISLQYVQLDGVSQGNDKTGIITGDGLNIRSGPGTNYASVGSLNSGDRVTVVNTVVADGITWGNIDKGWISMAYVQLD